MKHILTLACLALLFSLAAFSPSGTQPNKAKLILPTQAGEITFNSATVPASLDGSGEMYFEFKPSGFTSGDASKDANLHKLMIEGAYHTVIFTGKLEKGIEHLARNTSFKTAAIGKLKFAGREQGLRVPVVVRRLKNDNYAFSADAMIDWAQNPACKPVGAELGATGPLRFTITSTLK